MRKANYEILEDQEGFFGSIPPLQGVWAHGRTLEECREELKSTLEAWLLFSISRQDQIPPIDGLDLTVRQVA